MYINISSLDSGSGTGRSVDELDALASISLMQAVTIDSFAQKTSVVLTENWCAYAGRLFVDMTRFIVARVRPIRRR